MKKRKTKKAPSVCLYVALPAELNAFLEVESKRLTESLRNRKVKRVVAPADVIRSLVTAYYEKRTAGLLVGPDD